MTNLVTLTREGPVGILTLNQPEKRNAVSTELTSALVQQMQTLQDDRSCRAIVLTGGQHFCAGGSLDSLSTNGLTMRQDMRDGHRLLRLINTGRVPVIAAVQGAAFGAGLSLAAICDFVVADNNSRFGAVYGKVAIMPDWGALWSLPQRMGLGATRELVMLNKVLDGATAQRQGLVDILAEDGKVLETALERARELANCAPGAISATKAALSRFPQSLDILLDWEADTQALLIASEDFAAGRDAFFSKDTAQFKGL